MSQQLLWWSSAVPRWEICPQITDLICFHFYSGHPSLRISQAPCPEIGVEMSGLLLNIGLQGVKVSGDTDLFVCPLSRPEPLIQAKLNYLSSIVDKNISAVWVWARFQNHSRSPHTKLTVILTVLSFLSSWNRWEHGKSIIGKAIGQGFHGQYFHLLQNRRTFTFPAILEYTKS